MKVAVRDYARKPCRRATPGRPRPTPSGRDGYWKETEANITRHDVALVQPPCWVAYPPDVQRRLEQAAESNLPRVQTGPSCCGLGRHAAGERAERFRDVLRSSRAKINETEREGKYRSAARRAAG